MKNKFKVSRVKVTELINILLIFENKGNKYVDLICTITDNKDTVMVDKSKKRKKSKKKMPFKDTLLELLKHV